MDLPARVGPVLFGTLGGWIAVRCPRDLAPLMRQAGGPLIRNLSELGLRVTGSSLRRRTAR